MNIDIGDEDEEKKIIDDDNNKNKKDIISSITIGVTSDTLQFEGTVPMNNYEVCPSFEFNKTAKYQYRLSLLRPALRAIAKSCLIRINFNKQDAIQIHHVFEEQNNGWVEYVVLPQDTNFVHDDDDDD